MYDMYPGWDPATPERTVLESQVPRWQRREPARPHERVRAVQESMDRRDNGGRDTWEDAFAWRGEETRLWRGKSG